MQQYRIGILTGGGDCAGINPAVKWAVKSALDSRLSADRDTRYEVLGIKNGWEGLMELDPANLSDSKYLVPLTEEMVRPGTVTEARTWAARGPTLTTRRTICRERSFRTSPDSDWMRSSP